MKNANEQLFAYLSSQPEFTDVMNGEIDGQTVTKLFPLICDGDTPHPFSIYETEATPLSKDQDDFTFYLSAYFKPEKYDECLSFIDAIKPVIEKKYNWISSLIGIAEEDLSFVATINFKT